VNARQPSSCTHKPHKGTPAAEQPAEWLKKILRGRLIVHGQVLMASDALPPRYDRPKGYSVSLQVNTPAEAERIFHSLTENGQVQMPIQQTFWTARFGMLVDRFGIPWMINCEKAA
jgi:PhnB protein